MTGSLSTVRLRPGETVLLSDRESRVLRALADGFVCALSVFIGVGFHWLVMGDAARAAPWVLLTIALTLAPLFLFMTTRPLSHVLLTDQRLFVGPDPAEMRSAEYHQIVGTRLWLATLFLRLRNGEMLSVGNMRKLYAIEAEILHRSPR